MGGSEGLYFCLACIEDGRRVTTTPPQLRGWARRGGKDHAFSLQCLLLRQRRTGKGVLHLGQSNLVG